VKIVIFYSQMISCKDVI